MAYTVTSPEDIENLADNRIIGAPEMSDSRIIFKGTGNILWCEEGVNLESCVIRFSGDNGLVMLGRSRFAYDMDVTVNSNCSLVFGRNVYFNGQLRALASEECTVAIGDDCLISFGIWIRTADPHLVYDCKTHKRINLSKNIVIGDHVWLGQGALILKGSFIGSGSIVGGMSVVAGKKIPSNASWAGNPAKQVRTGLFWEGSVVHAWTSQKTKKYLTYPHDDYIFYEDLSTLGPDAFVSNAKDAAERMAHYLAIGYDNIEHNRLAYVVRKRSRKLRWLRK